MPDLVCENDDTASDAKSTGSNLPNRPSSFLSNTYLKSVLAPGLDSY